VQQILAARLDGGAQHLRIGGDEIRRGHRVQVLARVESQLAARCRIKVAGAGHPLQQPLGGQQITLADEIERRQLPIGVPEAAICRRTGGRDHPLSAERRQSALPQLRVAVPELHLRLQQPRRIAQQRLVQRRHRLAETTHHAGHNRRISHWPAHA
jgi:hypothetical protein